MAKENEAQDVDIDASLDKFFDSLDDDTDDVDDIEQDQALEAEADKAVDEEGGDDDLSLEERMALLEKENKGLRKDIVKVRGDKREYKEQLSSLTSLIKEVGGKKSDAEQAIEEKADPLKDLKLPVEYDEDGKPFVPASALAGVIQEQNENIELTQKQIEAKALEDQQLSSLQRTIDSIVSKDEKFPTAFKKVESIVKEVNESVIEIQKEQGGGKLLSPGKALDLLEQEGALDELQTKYPGVDFDVVAAAFESERNLTKALKSITKLDIAEDEDKFEKNAKNLDNDALKKIGKKPSSHGKGGTKARESIVERVGSATSEDILALDDAAVEKLLKRMREEELSNY